MLIKDQYDMITPEKKYPLAEYEIFYESLGQIFKMSLIENKLFHEIKSSLPAYFLEISQNSIIEDEKIDINLTLLGLERKTGKREGFSRDISDSNYIQKYFDSDLKKYIDFYTNYQQFILIFSNFEGTINSFLNKKGCKNITQAALINKILGYNTNFINKFNELTNYNFEKKDFENYWKYYLAIRHLYAHKFAIIEQTFINKITEIENYLNKINSRLYIENSILQTDDFFQLKEIKLDNIFAISDSNMRLYREFLIHIWETIYCLENPNFNGVIASNPHFTSNKFSFKQYSTEEQLTALHTLPVSLSDISYYFKPSGYMCPICNKNDFFLYNAIFNVKDLDVLFNFKSKVINGKKIKHVANIVYTCPFCKSLFFPEYQKNLSDNTGFNLINLPSLLYFNALNLIQEISKS